MSKRVIKAEYALSDMCSRYTNIKSSDIEVFSPVFYPVAKIDVAMHEKSFEDFDAVQESVLRFVSIGFKDEKIISDLMALTPDYILKMLKLLVSYGHIDNNRNLTSLGADSLAQGQKIVLENTRQQFLLDALNCNIIRIDRDLDRTIIERIDEMQAHEKHIAFLDHAAGISASTIEQTLLNSQYSSLRRMPGGMNINVVEVSDVRCFGIRYIKSYLLKLKNHSPIIFAKRFDPDAKGAQRFYWLPFSVLNDKEKEFLNLKDITVHTQETEEMINDVYQRIIECGQSQKVQDQLKQKLSYFINDHFKLDIDLTAPKLVVSSKNFSQFTYNSLRLLKSFAQNGFYLLVDDDLSGNIISVYPDVSDNVLKECCQKINQVLEKYNRDKLVSVIEKNYNTDIPVVENILNAAKKLIG